MNQKDLLADLVAMGFQPKQENILYGGNLGILDLSLHSYLIWDGESLSLNTLPTKGYRSNDYQRIIIYKSCVCFIRRVWPLSNHLFKKLFIYSFFI